MPGTIQERAGYLAVDCGSHSNARELSQLYRDFAVACVEKQVSRVLLKAKHGSVEAHFALRDALTMMLLAGIPSEFKIGFVADSPPTAQALQALRDELRRLGVVAALFDAEEPAVAWLRPSVPESRRPG
jgi:hypothetical protein